MAKGRFPIGVKVKKALAVYADRGHLALSLISSGSHDEAVEVLAQRDRGFANLKALIHVFDGDNSVSERERASTNAELTRILSHEANVNTTIRSELEAAAAKATSQLGTSKRAARILASYRS